MKKILNLFILFLSLLAIGIVVKAEAFHGAEKVDGIYVSRIKDGENDHYFGQLIRDSHDRFVYCIEPYEDLEDNKGDYTAIEDLKQYKNLSSSQLRRIELLIYYGFGYDGRTSNEWYVITQFLIWKTVSPETDIYFTDQTYHERLDNKFSSEISAIEKDVAEHDNIPSFVHDYEWIK